MQILYGDRYSGQQTFGWTPDFRNWSTILGRVEYLLRFLTGQSSRYVMLPPLDPYSGGRKQKSLLIGVRIGSSGGGRTIGEAESLETARRNVKRISRRALMMDCSPALATVDWLRAGTAPSLKLVARVFTR